MLNFTFAYANHDKNKVFIATQIAICGIVNPCKQVSDFLITIQIIHTFIVVGNSLFTYCAIFYSKCGRLYNTRAFFGIKMLNVI